MIKTRVKERTEEQTSTMSDAQTARSARSETICIG